MCYKSPKVPLQGCAYMYFCVLVYKHMLEMFLLIDKMDKKFEGPT